MAKKVGQKKQQSDKKTCVKKNVERGQAHIQSSFNNTIVTLQMLKEMLYHGQVQVVLDLEVQKIYSICSTDGSRNCNKAALIHGLKTVDVMVKGPGSGSEAAIRALSACGLEVTSIKRCYSSST